MYIRLLLLSLLLLCQCVHSSTNQLPTIGEPVTIGSTAEEKRIGQAWLRLFRQQAPLNNDPLILEYTEALLARLAKHDPDAGEEFSLVVVNNREINAFAVPGGIIGVNTGLYNYAQTENQFASVMAHELAHLSQRHYSRGQQSRKGQQALNMAALLASLLIAANSDTDAGIAALSASQASFIDRQLKLSRLHEEEADRIGMETLVKAGFDPHGMVDMFEQMQRASLFSSEPPEFLLTHPITARRIADAENRARAYPNRHSASSIDYDLVRARILFSMEETPQQAVQRFESEIRGFSPSEQGSRYGLVLALTAVKDYDKAHTVLSALKQQYPGQAALIIAQSNIDAGNNNLPKALADIKAAWASAPQSQALGIHYAQLLTTNQDYSAALAALNKVQQRRPNDPYLWFHIAEISGLSGDILNLHKARAEYFILNGRFNNAANQLNNILKKFGDDPDAKQHAKQRLADLKIIQKNSKL
ncbi:MAG: M48 family metalloprotease [Pseudomonadota bacterium]